MSVISHREHRDIALLSTLCSLSLVFSIYFLTHLVACAILDLEGFRIGKLKRFAPEG
jgi:hypothetical protein